MHQSDRNTDRQSATLTHPQQPELITNQFIPRDKSEYINNNNILLRTHGPYHRHKSTKSG